ATPMGLQDLQVGYAELRERARPLADHANDCEACPGNAAYRGYGCFGSVRYPIPRWTEKWLLNRLQPAGTLGGDRFLAALDQLDGRTVRALRTRGAFQLEDPLERTLSKGWFRRVTIDVD